MSKRVVLVDVDNGIKRYNTDIIVLVRVILQLHLYISVAYN